MSTIYHEGRVVIRSCDTDVLIVLLTHASSLDLCIWLDIGLSSNNTRRYIDVSRLAAELGEVYCAALPAFHAFTGCDYTAAFMRKGKVCPLEIIEKERNFMEMFSKLGDHEVIPENVSEKAEAFVCTLYGKPCLTSINDARFAIFQQVCAPKRKDAPLEKIKTTDSSLLPPCKAALTEKLKRVNLVASVWKNANKLDPYFLDPKQNGWILDNSTYKMKWFTGLQIPHSVCKHIVDQPETEPEVDIVYNSSSDESDADFE